MIYLICYDIQLDRVRTKVAKTLLAAGGVRLQYSVFALRKNKVGIQQLRQELQQQLFRKNKHAKTDKILCLKIHRQAFDQAWAVGAPFLPQLISADSTAIIFI